jgi:SAM-dependent methyltransferase
MKKSKFNKGQSVFLHWSDNKIEGPYTVKNATFQPLTRIYMYSFEEKGFACGEMYLKLNKEDKKLKYSDCVVEEKNNYNRITAETVVGDFLSKNKKKKEYDIMQSTVGPARLYNGDYDVTFFRADNKFCKWLKEYAGNRIIVDVGCGNARLLEHLSDAGARVFGIEPNLNSEHHQKMNEKRILAGLSMINILPKPVEECSDFLSAMGDKALIIICRPCHGNFVENTIRMVNGKTEILYITIPENLENYDDLGVYKSKAKEIKYTGFCAENEVVYSIK